MKSPEITEEIAIRLRDLIDLGLPIGMGKPVPGEMCIEACVCFALGLPHSDKPLDCVAGVLNSLKISLNDKEGWGTPQNRAKGLRRLGLAQLGSAGILNELEFAKRIAEMTIRKVVPIALRTIVNQTPAIRAAISVCETEGTMAGALQARDAAYAYVLSANVADVAIHASNASNVAIHASNVADVADVAIYAAADAAAIYAVRAANAAADTVDASTPYTTLSWFAEECVQILIDMKAPGCKWLYLVPLETTEVV